MQEIIKQMKKKKVTAWDLAVAMGLSVQSVYNKLHGKSQFNWDEVRILQKQLQFDDPIHIFFGQ